MNRHGIVVLLTTLLSVCANATDMDGLERSMELERLPATRLSLSKHDLPTSVTVITKANIREHGYRTIPETLRAVPGFRVTQSSSGSYYIAYQGYGAAFARRMSIAIDSVPVLTADYRSIDWYRLPVSLDDVEQIIVTRGTNGAAFGDNAFLASINIITTSPEDVDGSTLTVGYGSKKTGTAFARNRGEFQSTKYSASLSNESTAGFDTTGDGGPRHDDIDISRLNWSSITDINSSVRARVNANFYDSMRESVVAVPGQIDTKPVDAREFLFANKWEFDLSATSNMDVMWSVEGDDEDYGNTACYPAIGFNKISNELYLLNPEYAKSFYLGTEYHGLPLTAQEQAVFNELTRIVAANYPASMARTCANFDLGRKGESADLEVNYHLSWGDMSSTAFGVSGNRLKATSDSYLGGSVEREYYRVFTETAYVTPAYTINLGGLVEDVSTFSHVEWGARSSFNYHLRDSQTLRLEASRSFRFPSIMETDRTFAFHPEILNPVPWTPADTVFALSSPSASDRRPETIHSYAIGYLVSSVETIRSFDAKIFYNEIHHSCSDPVNLLIPATSIVPEDFETSGAEFGASTKLTRYLDFDVTYSYIDNNSTSVYERSLHSRHAGSAALKLSVRDNESVSLNYYGNSPISGLSYDRFDVVYYRRFASKIMVDTQFGIQHLVSRTVGVRDVWPEGEVLSSYSTPNLFFAKAAFNFD